MALQPTNVHRFRSQTPFFMDGLPYDYDNPLRLFQREVDCGIFQPSKRPQETQWVVEYHGQEREPEHVCQILNHYERHFSFPLREQTDVFLDGFHKLARQGENTVWLFRYRCHEYDHPDEMNKEIYFIGPVCPSIEFHVIHPVTKRPLGLSKVLDLNSLAFGNYHAFESLVLSQMTRLHVSAREQLSRVVVRSNDGSQMSPFSDPTLEPISEIIPAEREPVMFFTDVPVHDPLFWLDN